MLHSLGARMIGYDPAVHHTAPIWPRLHIQPVSLQELMAHSDAVSVTVMYASRYQHFINDKMLAHCKPARPGPAPAARTCSSRMRWRRH